MTKDGDLVLGTQSDDTLEGTSGSDLIISFKGDDVIDAGDGNDKIIAGSGSDEIDAGDGNDKVFAGSGDDVVDAGDGNDKVYGGFGDDVIDAGEGDDKVYAGFGNDILHHDVNENLDNHDYANGGWGYDHLIIHLNFDQADEVIAAGIIDDFNSTSSWKLFEFSDYDLSFSFDLDVRNFESVALDINNVGPQAFDDSASVVEAGFANPNEPAEVVGNVLLNDQDENLSEGDELRVSAVNGQAADVGAVIVGLYGTLTLNADGSYSYELDNDNPVVDALNEGDSLSDVFEYTVSDRGDLSDIGQLVINIDGSDDNAPPVAVADSTSIVEAGFANPNEPAEVVGNVLLNDQDENLADGDELRVSAVNGQAAEVGAVILGVYGTLTLNADGSYIYELDNDNPAVQALDEGDVVSDIFDYTVSDTGDLSDSTQLVINIEGSKDNIVPVAVNDTDTIRERGFANPNQPENVFGNVLLNDQDENLVDGDQLRVSEVNGQAADVGVTIDGQYGTLTLNADGSYDYQLRNDNADVDNLDQGESLTDTFEYTVSDSGDLSDTAQLVITINGSDDNVPPVAVADSFTTDDNSGFVELGNLLSNDSDVDSAMGTLRIANAERVSISLSSGYDNLDENLGSLTTGVAASGDPDGPISIFIEPEGILSNDINFEQARIEVARDGTISINKNGTFDFLAEGESAEITIEYSVEDDEGGVSELTTATILITGTDNADVIIGTPGDDVLNGGDSNDVIYGLGGNDTINGGTGSDTIEGGAGADTINGDSGSDTINGGIGNDEIDGGLGDDIINGGNGNDEIDGDLGDDIINGGDGNDIIIGGRDDDTINGDDGNDNLSGSGGNDTIDGGAGDDFIDGGFGDDLLIGGPGADTFDDSPGMDTIIDDGDDGSGPPNLPSPPPPSDDPVLPSPPDDDPGFDPAPLPV